jgi:phosphoadenosine phosphosulfate reductase
VTVRTGFEALPVGHPDVVRLASDVAAASAELERAWAGDVLAWAAAEVPRFAVTSSFGADSAVLLHLVATVAPRLPVLFLDTGLHFERTLHVRRELADRLGLHVVDVTPPRTVAQQAADVGDRLWERDPDRCCALRKTVPLRRAVAPFDGWASGVRRDQTPERAGTPVVAASPHGDRIVLKVAPLATWGPDDVATYLDVHDLPRHPLAEEGYASIGCAPCTVRTAPGQDTRAGRWAAFAGKTECGIHLDDGATP